MNLVEIKEYLYFKLYEKGVKPNILLDGFDKYDNLYNRYIKDFSYTLWNQKPSIVLRQAPPFYIDPYFSKYSYSFVGHSFKFGIHRDFPIIDIDHQVDAKKDDVDFMCELFIKSYKFATQDSYYNKEEAKARIRNIKNNMISESGNTLKYLIDRRSTILLDLNKINREIATIRSSTKNSIVSDELLLNIEDKCNIRILNTSQNKLVVLFKDVSLDFDGNLYNMGDIEACIDFTVDINNSQFSLPGFFLKKFPDIEKYHEQYSKKSRFHYRTGYIHPHIDRQGFACFGGYGSLLQTAAFNSDIATLLITMNKFIREYNDSNPYINLIPSDYKDNLFCPKYPNCFDCEQGPDCSLFFEGCHESLDDYTHCRDCDFSECPYLKTELQKCFLDTFPRESILLEKCSGCYNFPSCISSSEIESCYENNHESCDKYSCPAYNINQCPPERT